MGWYFKFLFVNSLYFNYTIFLGSNVEYWIYLVIIYIYI
jgi:hypothetical protein